MSLFKLREWWSAALSSHEDEFASGHLCVENLDNNSDGYDRVAVGSFTGLLVVYAPTGHYNLTSEHNVIFETRLDLPILQLGAGRFIT